MSEFDVINIRARVITHPFMSFPKGGGKYNTSFLPLEIVGEFWDNDLKSDPFEVEELVNVLDHEIDVLSHCSKTRFNKPNTVVQELYDNEENTPLVDKQFHIKFSENERERMQVIDKDGKLLPDEDRETMCFGAGTIVDIAIYLQEYHSEDVDNVKYGAVFKCDVSKPIAVQNLVWKYVPKKGRLKKRNYGTTTSKPNYEEAKGEQIDFESDLESDSTFGDVTKKMKAMR